VGFGFPNPSPARSDSVSALLLAQRAEKAESSKRSVSEFGSLREASSLMVGQGPA